MGTKEKSPKKRLSWLKRLAYLAVCLLILVAVAEVGLRIAKVAFSPKTVASGPAEDCRALVILCIGDSFTYGLGAEKGEAYPDQLASFLKWVYPDTPVKIYNIAVPGTNTSEQIWKMRHFFNSNRGAKVDFAFILTGVNNRWNLHEASFWQWEENAKKEHAAEYLQSKLQLAKFFKIAARNRISLVKSARTTQGSAYRKMLAEHGWDMFFDSFNDDLLARWITYDYSVFVKYLRVRKVEPLFLTYHYPRFPHMNERMRKSAAEVGAPVIELEKHFKFYARHNMLSGDRFHMNGPGYRAFAKRVAAGFSSIYDRDAIDEKMKNKRAACAKDHGKSRAGIQDPG